MKKINLTYITLIFCLVFISACGTKVSAKYMEPARFAVGGIRTLGVAYFDPAGCCGERLGDYLKEKVADELEKNDFYKVIIDAPMIDVDGHEESSYWQRWCRENNADGVVAGKIERAQVVQSVTYRKVEEKDYTGRYRDRVYVEGGQIRRDREEIVRSETRLIPRIRKDAYLRVAVGLFDADTGRRIEYKTYNDRSSKSKEGDIRVRDVLNDEEMLESLARKLAREIASDLLPHEKSRKIELASGKDTKDGEKFAKDGNWSAAKSSWQAVLANDPANDAAWYNLGVAAEVSGDYFKAEENYKKALSIKETSMYQNALERVNRRKLQQRKYEEQTEGR